MASFVIEGGHSLSGDIYPQGAKNEVLQIICATPAHCRRGDGAQHTGHPGCEQPDSVDAGYGSERIEKRHRYI